MAQEETQVPFATNSATAGGEGTGWQARFRRGWRRFVTALLRALSTWVV